MTTESSRVTPRKPNRSTVLSWMGAQKSQRDAKSTTPGTALHKNGADEFPIEQAAGKLLKAVLTT